MKKLILAALLSFAYLSMTAQTDICGTEFETYPNDTETYTGTECITHNGYYITPRGNLHILVLFVTFNDYNAPDNDGIG